MSILCYHAVDADWPAPMSMEPDLFGRHCAWLARRRTVVPVTEALRLMDHRGRLPRGMAALTFDDGFTSVHTQVLPQLRRTGLPATVFLVAETLTDQGRAVDWVDRPPAYPLTTLTLDQVHEMRDAGIDFQSHSWAHRDLTTLPYDECLDDLRRSRELLQDLLGAPVTQLAYPRGRHNPTVRRAARDAGYDHAFALPESREQTGAYAVPRVGVHRGNGTAVLAVKDTRPYLAVRTAPAYGPVREALRGPRAVTRSVARRR